MVIHHQLELINNLLLRKPVSEVNIEERINDAQKQEKTPEELAQLVTKVDSAFTDLHKTLQSLDELELSNELLGDNNTHTKKEMSALDRTNDEVVKQLCTVDAILEELALFIDNNSLKVKSKSAAIEAIKQARAIIESRKYDRGQVTEASIYDLLMLNKYLIGHVCTMIGNDFNTLPALDEAILTTRTKREITFEELDQKYQNNQTILADLREASKNAGLKNYHLFFRALESHWNKTLDSGRRILWPALGAFSVSAACHLLGYWPSSWDFNVPFLNMPFYGESLINAASKASKAIASNASAAADSAIQAAQPSMPIPTEWHKGVVGSALYYGGTIMSNIVITAPAALAYYYGKSDANQITQVANDYLAKLGTFLVGRKEVKKSNILTHKEPRYTFKDVVGQQETKEELSRLVRYFEDPQGVDNRGVPLETGYLLTGKTRSGKSFMAEAVAGEIRAALKRAGKDENSFKFIVAPPEILRMPGGLKMCMDHARYYAPCILFIDELHLFDLQAGKNNPLLIEFLNELSGVMSNCADSKVFVMAATNREDLIDKPLRSAGRFGKEIHFDYPTYADRRTFISNILEKRTINVQSDKWARAINQFACETEDCNFEDIRRTIDDAFLSAKENAAALEPAYLNQSLDKNIRGILSVHDHTISNQERNIVAAHQAGYILATKILAPHLTIAKVTTGAIREKVKERSFSSQWFEKNDDTKTDERLVWGKTFTYGKKMSNLLITMQEQLNACIIASAGYAAGNIQLGAANNSASYLSEKRQDAFNIAKMSITKGVNIDEFNDTLKNEFLKRALALRSSCETKAAMLMEQNKEALNALYQTLLKYGTLSGKAVDMILNQYPLKGLAFDQSIFNFIEEAPMSA